MNIFRAIAILAIGMLTIPCHADLLITVPNVTITVGGTRSVSVLIQSNGADEISVFNVEFALMPAFATPGTGLGFVDPGPSTEDFVSVGNYIFDGQGIAEFFDAPVALLSGSFPPVLLASDAVFPNANVTVPTATAAVLVQFDVQHLFPGGTDPASLVGDTFSLDNNLIVFEQYNSVTDSFEPFAGLITYSAGTITVVAVPEPSGFAIMMAGIGHLTLYRRRRRAI